jgi:hypothetical protein
MLFSFAHDDLFSFGLIGLFGSFRQSGAFFRGDENPLFTRPIIPNEHDQGAEAEDDEINPEI